MSRASLLVGLAALLASGCGTGNGGDRQSADSLIMHERATRFERALADSSHDPEKPMALWKLPAMLKELSGLAFTRDGRLLTHGDERGKVFEVDYRRGVIIKSFTVGSPTMVHGDFEAITVVGDSVLLLTSDGLIYHFREGANGTTVPFTLYDTGLGQRCEFEAMTFDSTANGLLLACKIVHEKALKGQLVIFRVPLGTAGDSAGPGVSMLSIPEERLLSGKGHRSFHTSDMAINPVNGNYVLIASIEKEMLEVTPAGEVVALTPLPKGHDQPEGLAISPGHFMAISDEAKGNAARLTLYRWP